MSHDGTDGSHPPVEDLDRLGRKIQELVAQMDEVADPGARELLRECMEAVVAFYGQGLARILEVTKSATPDGRKVYDALARDSVVRGLLLIHGLHPVDLQTRLREALDKVRPYLESHGGSVELISLRNDVARLRLVGHCRSCASSTVTLELAIRQAIEEACPDLVGFEVEGVEPAGADSAATTMPPHALPEWIVIDGAAQLADGDLLPIHARGVALVICKADRELYAYRDKCPACNLPLHLGSLLESGLLDCGAGHQYDLRRAGQCVENGALHLDPFPLLVEDGVTRVALPVSGNAGERVPLHATPAPNTAGLSTGEVR